MSPELTRKNTDLDPGYQLIQARLQTLDREAVHDALADVVADRPGGKESE